MTSLRSVHPFLHHISLPYFRLALSLAGIVFAKQLLKVFFANLHSLKTVFQANVSVPFLSSAPQAASGNVRPGKHSPSPHPPPPQTSPSFSFNLSPNLFMGQPRKDMGSCGSEQVRRGNSKDLLRKKCSVCCFSASKHLVRTINSLLAISL